MRCQLCVRHAGAAFVQLVQELPLLLRKRDALSKMSGVDYICIAGYRSSVRESRSAGKYRAWKLGRDRLNVAAQRRRPSHNKDPSRSGHGIYSDFCGLHCLGKHGICLGRVLSTRPRVRWCTTLADTDSVAVQALSPARWWSKPVTNTRHTPCMMRFDSCSSCTFAPDPVNLHTAWRERQKRSQRGERSSR